jgi:hypothetical protein
MRIKRSIAGAALAVGVALAAGGAHAATFVVSYEGEKAGVQNTTATFSTVGVETFDTQQVHAYPKSFTTDFGTAGAIKGTYAAGSASGVQINSADQYGGAGGQGNYIVAFSKTPYSLTLTSSVEGGLNYFGYWLSALDRGNYVTFYGNGGRKLFTFDPKDVINAVKASGNPSEYYGNPNESYLGKNSHEPYIFINFFDTSGSFSKIEFSEVNYGGGYESDNHTVGHYLTMGHGTFIPLVSSVAAPEPATWAMMLVGLAGLGFAGYRARRSPVSIDS